MPGKAIRVDPVLYSIVNLRREQLQKVENDHRVTMNDALRSLIADRRHGAEKLRPPDPA